MNTVISFSCPAHLAMRLAEQNIPARQKSQWIADAISTKLDGRTGIFSMNKRDVLIRSISIIYQSNPALAKLIQEHIEVHDYSTKS